MNKEVIFSFLFPFSLIEVLLRSTIFYHKIEEKAQIYQVPPARAPRIILCCTWSIHMCSVWWPKKSHLIHFHVSMFVMGTKWMFNKCCWMNFEQMPIFRALDFRARVAIPKSQQPAKPTTLLCKLLDWALGRCTHRYVKTTIWLS